MCYPHFSTKTKYLYPLKNGIWVELSDKQQEQEIMSLILENDTPPQKTETGKNAVVYQFPTQKRPKIVETG